MFKRLLRPKIKTWPLGVVVESSDGSLTCDPNQRPILVLGYEVITKLEYPDYPDQGQLLSGPTSDDSHRDILIWRETSQFPRELGEVAEESAVGASLLQDLQMFQLWGHELTVATS